MQNFTCVRKNKSAIIRKHHSFWICVSFRDNRILVIVFSDTGQNCIWMQIMSERTHFTSHFSLEIFQQCFGYCPDPRQICGSFKLTCYWENLKEHDKFTWYVLLSGEECFKMYTMQNNLIQRVCKKFIERVATVNVKPCLHFCFCNKINLSFKLSFSTSIMKEIIETQEFQNHLVP